MDINVELIKKQIPNSDGFINFLKPAGNIVVEIHKLGKLSGVERKDCKSDDDFMDKKVQLIELQQRIFKKVVYSFENVKFRGVLMTVEMLSEVPDDFLGIVTTLFIEVFLDKTAAVEASPEKKNLSAEQLNA